MAKSKSRPQRSRSDDWFQTTIRIPESERAALEQVAQFDGFTSIPQWLLHLGSTRAKRAMPAIESGDFVEVNGRNVLLIDLPQQKTTR